MASTTERKKQKTQQEIDKTRFKDFVKKLDAFGVLLYPFLDDLPKMIQQNLIDDSDLRELNDKLFIIYVGLKKALGEKDDG